MEQNNAIQNEEQEIDLLELFHALRRKWYMLLAALLVFALAAGAGTKLLITPQYQSSAMIYILTKTTSVTSLADLQIGSQLTIEYSGRFYTPIPEIGNRRSDVKETALPF